MTASLLLLARRVPCTEITGDLRRGCPAEHVHYLEVFTNTRISGEQISDYAAPLPRSDQQICPHSMMPPSPIA